MSQLSTFYSPLTAASLGLGNSANVTFGSVTTGAVTASGTLSGAGFTNRFASPGPIGSTTPSTGAFTTLNANNGTQTSTAFAPALTLAQTWNTVGHVFSAFIIDITNTASNGNSTFLTCRAGGVSALEVRTNGNIIVPANGSFNCSGTVVTSGQVSVASTGTFAFTSGTGGFSGQDTFIRRDAASTIAFRDLANPQTFRIYNTTDAGLTNFERGFMRWSSNVLQIGTEKGGTGSARALEFQTDGAARWRINATSRAFMAMGGGAIIGSEESYGVTIGAGAGATWATGFFSPNGTGTGYLAIGEALHFGLATNGTSGDTRLFRDAASALALRNSTTAQIFRIYNTVSGTGNVNFERANLRWASNEFIIDAEAGGTGTSLRGIKIGSATSSLLGFYGATPVDRPNDVVMSWASDGSMGDVSDAQDLEARAAVFEIRARLRELGLMAAT